MRPGPGGPIKREKKNNRAACLEDSDKTTNAGGKKRGEALHKEGVSQSGKKGRKKNISKTNREKKRKKCLGQGREQMRQKERGSGGQASNCPSSRRFKKKYAVGVGLGEKRAAVAGCMKKKSAS